LQLLTIILQLVNNLIIIAICQHKFFSEIYIYYWKINLCHPLWKGIDFNTFFNQILPHCKTWNFLYIWFHTIYNEEKSTWSNFNYLYDDTWTKKKLTCGICNIFLWKFNFIKILIWTIHNDYLIYMYLYCDAWHNQKLPCGILIEFWKKKKLK
jgi:hypothetical protein